MQSICEIFAGFADEEERSALTEFVHEVFHDERDSHPKLVVLDDNARRRAFLKRLEKHFEQFGMSPFSPDLR
jgi:hypothetical protein